MDLYKLQSECTRILGKEGIHTHVPLKLNGRFKNLLGRAHWMSGFHERSWIELSKSLSKYSWEYQLSVLIHEICHIILQQGHTSKFLELSDRLHKDNGLFEDRTSRRYHGKVYFACGDSITPITKDNKKSIIDTIPD